MACARVPAWPAPRCCWPAAARTEGSQDLRLRANSYLVYDSNLFRLPAGANTLALTGPATRPPETVRCTAWA